LKRLQEEYQGAKIFSHTVDMQDLSAYREVLESIYRNTARIDVIVNNAHPMNLSSGFNLPEGGLECASVEQVSRNITGGVYWPLLTVQILGRRMIECRRGSIINIATMYADIAPNPKLYEGTSYLNPIGYSVAKAGLMAFTRYVASFWGIYGIRSNAILPGPFPNTDECTDNAVRSDDSFIDRLKEQTCLKRVGHATELAGAILFLASDASSFVTGQGIRVDGGWSIT
jgi:gluconate 5-dehydrogenase